MQVDLDEVIDNKSRKFSNDIRSQLRKIKLDTQVSNSKK